MKVSGIQARFDQALVAVKSKAQQAGNAVKRVASSINFKQTTDSTKSTASALVGRIQKNWNNMSTAKKVATVAATTILVLGSVAAAIFGSHVAALLGLGAAIAHTAVVYGAPTVLGVASVATPAVALLRKKTEKKPVVEQKAPVESRKDKALNFVRNHRRAIVATTVLAGVAVLGYRNRAAIRALGQEFVGAPKATVVRLAKDAKTAVVALPGKALQKAKDAKTAAIALPGKALQTGRALGGAVVDRIKHPRDTARKISLFALDKTLKGSVAALDKGSKVIGFIARQPGNVKSGVLSAGSFVARQPSNIKNGVVAAGSFVATRGSFL